MPIEDCYKKIIYTDDELKPIAAEMKSVCLSKEYDDLQSIIANLDMLNIDCAIRCLALLDDNEILLLMHHELSKDNSHMPLLDLMLKKLYLPWLTSTENPDKFTVAPKLALLGLPKDPSDGNEAAFKIKLDLIASRILEINSLLWQCNFDPIPASSPLAAAIADTKYRTFLQLKTLLTCYQLAHQNPLAHHETIDTLLPVIGLISNTIVSSKPAVTGSIEQHHIDTAVGYTERFFNSALSNAHSSIPGNIPLRTHCLNQYLEIIKSDKPPVKAMAASAHVATGLMPAPATTAVSGYSESKTGYDSEHSSVVKTP
ncbi:MAG: hypothetical protein P1U63_01930 [Coxiellaceae bacterium]|nr:hypothetical protein [Coxiellaceae bacterium]